MVCPIRSPPLHLRERVSNCSAELRSQVPAPEGSLAEADDQLATAG